MKEIEKYIKTNQMYLEDCKEQLKKEKSETEINRLKINIERYEYYIMGLQDAKRYFERESK